MYADEFEFPREVEELDIGRKEKKGRRNIAVLVLHPETSTASTTTYIFHFGVKLLRPKIVDDVTN